MLITNVFFDFAAFSGIFALGVVRGRAAPVADFAGVREVCIWISVTVNCCDMIACCAYSIESQAQGAVGMRTMIWLVTRRSKPYVDWSSSVLLVRTRLLFRRSLDGLLKCAGDCMVRIARVRKCLAGVARMLGRSCEGDQLLGQNRDRDETL